MLALDDAIESLAGVGYAVVDRVSPLEARVSSPAGGVPVRLELTRDGRIFGGNYGLELATRGAGATAELAACPRAAREW